MRIWHRTCSVPRLVEAAVSSRRVGEPGRAALRSSREIHLWLDDATPPPAYHDAGMQFLHSWILPD